MDKIVSEIVDVLLSLPEGTELATSDVIKQLYGHKATPHNTTPTKENILGAEQK